MKYNQENHHTDFTITERKTERCTVIGSIDQTNSCPAQLQRNLQPTRHTLMSRSLQEVSSRWCHRSACLVLTIELYGNRFIQNYEQSYTAKQASKTLIREHSPQGKDHCTPALQHNWNGFDQKENMLLFVFTETTEPKPVKLETSRTFILPLKMGFSALTFEAFLNRHLPRC